VTNALYTYDSDDRLAADSYDADGNTIGSSSNSYQYSAVDQLTNVNSGAVIQWYDGDGNRVKKSVSGSPTYYLVDDRNPSGYAQVLEELDGAGAVARSYVYGLRLVSQSSSTTTNYYGYDGHGSTRVLFNTNGSVAQVYVYDAFGILIVPSFPFPSGNNYLYSGEQFDPDLGMYYLRARYYAPQSGRFLTMDTCEGDNEDPLSLHKYLYCAGNAVNNADPNGHDILGSFALMSGISTLSGMGSPVTEKAAVAAGVEGTCGPDVTLALKNTLDDAQQTFLARPDLWEKISDAIPLDMGDGWDIGPLMKLGGDAAVAGDFGDGATLGTGIGLRTVQVAVNGMTGVYFTSTQGFVGVLARLEWAEVEAGLRDSSEVSEAARAIGEREIVRTQLVSEHDIQNGFFEFRPEYRTEAKHRIYPDIIRLTRPNSDGRARLGMAVAKSFDSEIVVFACLPDKYRREDFLGDLMASSRSKLHACAMALVFGAEWRAIVAKLAVDNLIGDQSVIDQILGRE
jgi:RHS repeat-associated protein